MKHLCKKGR